MRAKAFFFFLLSGGRRALPLRTGLSLAEFQSRQMGMGYKNKTESTQQRLWAEQQELKCLLTSGAVSGPGMVGHRLSGRV